MSFWDGPRSDLAYLVSPIPIPSLSVAVCHIALSLLHAVRTTTSFPFTRGHMS